MSPPPDTTPPFAPNLHAAPAVHRVAWLACRVLPAPAPPCSVALHTAWSCVHAAPRAGAALPRVVALEICGLPAHALWHIVLRSRGAPIFELSAVSDRRGGWVVAGELLRDMGREAGLTGLTVDLGGVRPPLQGLAVELLVQLPADACATLALVARA